MIASARDATSLATRWCSDAFAFVAVVSARDARGDERVAEVGHPARAGRPGDRRRDQVRRRRRRRRDDDVDPVLAHEPDPGGDRGDRPRRVLVRDDEPPQLEPRARHGALETLRPREHLGRLAAAHAHVARAVHPRLRRHPQPLVAVEPARIVRREDVRLDPHRGQVLRELQRPLHAAPARGREVEADGHLGGGVVGGGGERGWWSGGGGGGGGGPGRGAGWGGAGPGPGGGPAFKGAGANRGAGGWEEERPAGPRRHSGAARTSAGITGAAQLAAALGKVQPRRKSEPEHEHGDSAFERAVLLVHAARAPGPPAPRATRRRVRPRATANRSVLPLGAEGAPRDRARTRSRRKTTTPPADSNPTRPPSVSTNSERSRRPSQVPTPYSSPVSGPVRVARAITAIEARPTPTTTSGLTRRTSASGTTRNGSAGTETAGPGSAPRRVGEAALYVREEQGDRGTDRRLRPSSKPPEERQAEHSGDRHGVTIKRPFSDTRSESAARASGNPTP